MNKSFSLYLGEVKKLNLPKGKYAIFGSGPLAIRNIRDTHDLDVIVKNDIYKDRLLRQKLMEKYQTDESLSEEARKQAEEILAKAKAGEDFATLAKTYSQDSTASEGGDLGLFEKGKMLPEFENVAFAMKVGEISDLVRTIYGYHIIKVTEIKGEQVRSSHILIKTVECQTGLDEAL